MGHRSPALQALGMGAALTETAMGASIELNPDPAVEPLKHGPSGWLIRVGRRSFRPHSAGSAYDQLIFKRQPGGEVAKYAAVSSVVGSAITRAAWIHAGHISARESQPASKFWESLKAVAWAECASIHSSSIRVG